MTLDFQTVSSGEQIAVNPDYNGGCYVIKTTAGISCLGYDRCRYLTLKYKNWLEKQKHQDRAILFDESSLPERGSIKMYEYYLTTLKHLKEFSVINRQERCNAALTPQLLPYLGHLVSVVDNFGETRSFRVGISTGWLPIHLEANQGNGGDAADDSYRSVTPIKKVK